MMKIIRKEHDEALVLVAGFNWAYDLIPVKKDPIDAKGIAYVSHPYPEKGRPHGNNNGKQTGDLWPISTRSS